MHCKFELFIKLLSDTYILSASLFSGPQDTEYKFFMTSRKPFSEKNHRHGGYYTFDPADAMFAPIPLKFNGNERDVTIGMFHKGMFFFYGGSVNRGIVPSANYEDYIKGLTHKIYNTLDFGCLMKDCGAVVLNDEHYAELDEEARKDIIDLSPEALTATTLLDIVDGNL